MRCGSAWTEVDRAYIPPSSRMAGDAPAASPRERCCSPRRLTDRPLRVPGARIREPPILRRAGSDRPPGVLLLPGSPRRVCGGGPVAEEHRTRRKGRRGDELQPDGAEVVEDPGS